jgi:predicted dehydrogenase
MSSERIVQVGLVGFGMAGQVFHAPLISSTPGMQLAAIVQRRSAVPPARYPHARIVPDIHTLVADPSIDLVVIATPNAAHADLARSALLVGKHVVVDKPFTTTSAAADELIALAAAQKRLLSVFQNRRWDGDFLTVSQLVRGGQLGRLTEYVATFDRFRPALRPHAWRESDTPGSGILFDLGAHLIDQALVLFGMPSAISAEVYRERDQVAADDRFELVLQYPRLRVQLGAGMLMRTPRPRFALAGTAGSYLKYGLDPQEDALKAGGTPADPHWGIETSTAWGTLHSTWNGLEVRGQVATLPGRYQDFYANIHAAICATAPLAVSAAQARTTIWLIEQALRSAHEQRTIPLDPATP